MKKYAITLLLLTLIGLALAVRLFTQEQKLDQTVFVETTKSIRNLQILDNQLARLLSESRFNNSFEHERLSDTNYQVSEEFDNLRFEALFEEIEGSPALSDAVANFENQFINREEDLDSYIESNQRINTHLSLINSTYQTISQSDLANTQTELNSDLIRNNNRLYRLALGIASDDASQLDTAARSLVNKTLVPLSQTLETPEAAAQALTKYGTSTIAILENTEQAKTLFSKLNEMETGALLSAIENKYSSYHNEAIIESNKLRNALLFYGLALLAALLFFGYQIRKNYVSLEQQVAERTHDIEDAYQQLSESQEQLIQSEKMASLGELVAGVAHEINTPLGYVTSNIDTVKFNLGDMNTILSKVQTLAQTAASESRERGAVASQLVDLLRSHTKLQGQELVNESVQLIGDGNYGLNEISKLVSSLKDFARLDRQAAQEIDITDCITNTLPIASNVIKQSNVTVETEFAELPAISCMPSKLNQLFLNVITNSCQAMKEQGGVLKIATQQEGDQILITFKDNGIGMDEETQQKMFDPFFTTKEIGEGTGLGMSIAYKIVQAHNGAIDVNSVIGSGTTIYIRLPIEA